MQRRNLKITKELPTLAILLVLLTIMLTPVSGQESSATSLDVDVQKYEPYPAEIGQYVDVWIKVENFRSGQSDDVSIRLVPEYPLSLDSENNAIKNIGILSPDTASVQEYRLYVDENAKPGTASFDVYYRGDSDSPWVKDTFEMKVGSTTFESKGTLELEDITANPGVFSPGDIGTVSFTLTNTATENTITFEGKDYDTNARVQSATLSGSEIIRTTSVEQDAGIIGPGNSVTLTFNVEVPEDTPEGTYYLDLSVIGNSHSYNNNWRVPLTVDSSSLKMIPSKPMTLTNGEGKIQFDVANLHPNTLSSVSIRPEAEGIKFSPAEYFIGTMKPDELFTIEFTAVVEDEEALTPLTLDAEYRNGFNDHTTSEEVGSFDLTEEDNGNGVTSAAAALGLAVVAGSTLFVYRKKKKD
ncbi:COG1361 S-layer family protein [Methanococcoides orientis]|uniref:COG1361 S-layer family protein n=1 Tax=Methanococcoides orientis TaxID=2822137 RepID=UPI001E5CC06D|nr:COG1361 S-layer family protein [Methanococcoides orientis]UGV41764.1 COG1361 S-layer family protein [Methanococcoides orientis]